MNNNCLKIKYGSSRSVTVQLWNKCIGCKENLAFNVKDLNNIQITLVSYNGNEISVDYNPSNYNQSAIIISIPSTLECQTYAISITAEYNGSVVRGIAQNAVQVSHAFEDIDYDVDAIIDIVISTNFSVGYKIDTVVKEDGKDAVSGKAVFEAMENLRQNVKSIRREIDPIMERTTNTLESNLKTFNDIQIKSKNIIDKIGSIDVEGINKTQAEMIKAVEKAKTILDSGTVEPVQEVDLIKVNQKIDKLSDDVDKINKQIVDIYDSCDDLHSICDSVSDNVDDLNSSSETLKTSADLNTNNIDSLNKKVQMLFDALEIIGIEQEYMLSEKIQTPYLATGFGVESYCYNGRGVDPEENIFTKTSDRYGDDVYVYTGVFTFTEEEYGVNEVSVYSGTNDIVNVYFVKESKSINQYKNKDRIFIDGEPVLLTAREGSKIENYEAPKDAKAICVTWSPKDASDQTFADPANFKGRVRIDSYTRTPAMSSQFSINDIDRMQLDIQSLKNKVS